MSRFTVAVAILATLISCSRDVHVRAPYAPVSWTSTPAQATPTNSCARRCEANDAGPGAVALCLERCPGAHEVEACAPRDRDPFAVCATRKEANVGVTLVAAAAAVLLVLVVAMTPEPDPNNR